MNQTDELLWHALEGALGAEKTAFLRHAPLTDVIPGGRRDFSVADAAGQIAKKASTQRQERQAIHSGLKALAALGADAPRAKTASLSEKVALAHKLQIAEQHSDERERVKTASYRHALNEDIVDTIKEAAVGGILEGVSKNPLLRDVGKKMLQAGAVGTGLAIPGYAAGSALSDTFTEDARNRALQTAAGVGGLGLMGYGGMKAIDSATEKMSSAAVSLGQVLPQEKVAHLATATYLDELLASVQQTEKVAGLRRLNREFIVEELLTKQAEHPYSEENPYLAILKEKPSLKSQLAHRGGGALSGGLMGGALGQLAATIADKEDMTPEFAGGGALLGALAGGALNAPPQRALQMRMADPEAAAAAMLADPTAPEGIHGLAKAIQEDLARRTETGNWEPGQ